MLAILEAQSVNLSQLFLKSTNVEVGTSAPISQNRF
jgi:hypothetical protein